MAVQLGAGGAAAACAVTGQGPPTRARPPLVASTENQVTCLVIAVAVRGSVVLRRLLLSKFRTFSSSGKLLPSFSSRLTQD